jgi:hypothetical protein
MLELYVCIESSKLIIILPHKIQNFKGGSSHGGIV